MDTSDKAKKRILDNILKERERSYERFPETSRHADHCVSCGQEVSGMGKCDACGKVLCFVCHEEKKQANGKACLCPDCFELNKEVEYPRWKK